LRKQADAFIAFCEGKLQEHHDYICANLDDMPEIKNWKWAAAHELVG
jgi:xylulose-5-phosphate/fructose-6-phosphate phosphoketolase